MKLIKIMYSNKEKVSEVIKKGIAKAKGTKETKRAKQVKRVKMPESAYRLSREEKKRIHEAVAAMKGVTRQRVSQLRGQDAEVDQMFWVLEDGLRRKKRQAFEQALPKLKRDAMRMILSGKGQARKVKR